MNYFAAIVLCATVVYALPSLLSQFVLEPKLVQLPQESALSSSSYLQLPKQYHAVSVFTRGSNSEPLYVEQWIDVAGKRARISYKSSEHTSTTFIFGKTAYKYQLIRNSNSDVECYTYTQTGIFDIQPHKFERTMFYQGQLVNSHKFFRHDKDDITSRYFVDVSTGDWVGQELIIQNRDYKLGTRTVYSHFNTDPLRDSIFSRPLNVQCGPMLDFAGSFESRMLNLSRGSF
ncbi:hypothetical protein MIR68_012449 [Amoeboaphelidium protococcarum]|nr:hypothetical protein MIR68_012449 [Amoeboaphelidium protococcarum]